MDTRRIDTNSRQKGSRLPESLGRRGVPGGRGRGWWLSAAFRKCTSVFRGERSLTVAALIRAARVSKRFPTRHRNSEREYEGSEPAIRGGPEPFVASGCYGNKGTHTCPNIALAPPLMAATWPARADSGAPPE